jgi:hypothetical protein
VVRQAAAIAIVAGVLLAGCGETSLIHRTEPRGTAAPAPQRTTRYLAALGASQSQLAAAERSIPRRPRTAAALARAIGQLHVAIQRLSVDLAAIRPPAPVAALHAELVGIARVYAAKLEHAARVAARPEGELVAVSRLSSATTQATRRFPATIDRIERTLVR